MCHFLRLKIFYVSKLVTDWKTNAACIFFSFFLIVSRSVKFELVTTFVMCEIWNLNFWWARYKTNINQSTEFKKFFCPICFILSVIFFNVYFGEKNIKQEKKIKAWILLNQTHTENKCTRQLWEFNLKRAWGAESAASTFVVISQPVVIFLHWNFMTFFLQALRLI